MTHENITILTIYFILQRQLLEDREKVEEKKEENEEEEEQQWQLLSLGN